MHYIVDVLNYTTSTTAKQTRLAFRVERLKTLIAAVSQHHAKSQVVIHLCVKYHTSVQRQFWEHLHTKLVAYAKKQHVNSLLYTYIVRAPFKCVTEKTGDMSTRSHNDCEPDDYLVIALANVLPGSVIVVSNDRMTNARLTANHFAPYFMTKKHIEHGPAEYIAKISQFSQHIVDQKHKYKLKGIIRYKE